MERYDGLDILRGVCAATILLYHLAGQSMFFSGLYVSTDMFFMISGFVLLPTYPNQNDGTQKLQWIIRRVIRLQPILLISTVFTIILVLLSESQRVSLNITSILGSIFFLQLFIPAAKALNTPLWSLSSEMIVNVLFLFCSKKARVILLLIFMLVGFQIYTYFTIFNPDYSTGILGLVRCATSFLIGVFLRGIVMSEIVQLVSRFWLLSAILSYLGAIVFRDSHSFLCIILAIPLFWKFTQIKVRGATKFIASFGRKYSYAFFVVHFPLIQFSDTLKGYFLSLGTEFFVWKVIQLGLVSICSLALAIVFSSFSKKISDP